MIIYTHNDCFKKFNGQAHPERKERLESIINSIKSSNLKVEFNPENDITDYYIEDILQRGIRDKVIEYNKPYISYDLFELKNIWAEKK